MKVTLDDLPKVAKKIVKALGPGDVLVLSGPLAAGKTAFTQELLRQMGYEGRITSPTFVLEKHYPVSHKDIKEVVHLDFYRLSPAELDSFGWKEYLDTPGTLTVIEWGEKASRHLPPRAKWIELKVADDQTRHFKFSENFGKAFADQVSRPV